MWSGLSDVFAVPLRQRLVSLRLTKLSFYLACDISGI